MGANAAIRPVSERRPFGAYYTPQAVADTLSEWAIRSKDNRVLEPGFGGCGFLEASLNRLTELGSTDPYLQLFGCDKDPEAFSILSQKFGDRGTDHFLLNDFLALSPSDFPPEAFDVVIGNPPYVSLHAMQEAQLATAIRAMDSSGVQLDKRASLWAYFVIHALAFLKEGGRCAWVLPSSYTHADYAQNVRDLFSAHFSKVTEISLEQRLFSGEGAKERTVIVLAEGYRAERRNKSVTRRFHVANAELLQGLMAKLRFNGKPFRKDSAYASPADAAADLLKKATQMSDVCKLGDHLDVKIGIVTGANSFFIKSDKEWKEQGIRDAWVKPIVAKFSQIAGLSQTNRDLRANQEQGDKCLLLDACERGAKLKTIQRYLASFPVDKKQQNATFKKRACWYCPDDGRTPDGFFSYMCDHGPRLALNAAGTTSTNTIHRIYFHDQVDGVMQKAIAVSLLTTVTQLSAELVGRSYGSGVLKLEPRESRDLDLLLPEGLRAQVISATFSAVDRLLRKGMAEEARLKADEVFASPVLGEELVVEMNAALQQLRAIRREPRKQV